ncbi:hypothetical protein KY321_03960 [Candidatus Woesearchaeota archaeon]|nr:hypothetical protein [Candidatus Woesearchaeota archaeon]
MFYESDNKYFIEEVDYKHAVDHLHGLVSDVYETGNLDDLEFHLQEILTVFEIPFKPKTIKLVSKKRVDKVGALLDGWKEYNSNFLKSLN